MITPIEINSDDIVSQYNITESQIQSMFDNIAKSLAMIYVSKLENEAALNLHSTKRRYIQNIRVIDSGKLESTVMLDYSKDKLVQMIEEGSSAFDMKPYLLNSSKAKTGKNGKKYITIPFRFGTPDSIAESEIFTAKMPQEIYNIVREKEVNIKGVSKGITQTELAELPKQFQINSVRPEIKDSAGKVLFKEYEHKSSVYQGIRRQSDSVTSQNTYFSFRRVSEVSDENSFIHKGIQAKQLMSKAYQKMNIPEEVGVQIDNELAKLGF